MESFWQKCDDFVAAHKRTLQVWGVYSIVALVVVLPLLGPGYILTLDLVFTPHLPWPSELTNSYGLEALLWLANQILPGDVIEKVILFLVLVLSGAGMYWLAAQYRLKTVPMAYWRVGAYFAGVLYMINPFTYARFMAGQWMVLLGYALLPFFVMALLKLLRSPSWATSWRLAAWLTVISVVSIHAVGLVVLVVAVAVGVVVWENRQKLAVLQPAAHWLGVALGGALLASSYWLLPTILGANSVGQAANSFGVAQFAGFATHSGPLGPLGEVLRLQGFWAEAEQLFALPGDVMPAWGLIAASLWIVVGLGVKYAWRAQPRVTLVIGVAAILAVLLAVTPVIAWISRVVPFIGGYREPHKFIALVALAFSFFAGVAVAVLLHEWRRRSAGYRYVAAGLLLLPVLLTPTMLWGFAGQLAPRHYPADWEAMNTYLNTEVDKGKILFLPWQQYLSFDFTRRTIANPADKFFEKPIIVSNELSFKDVPPTVPDAEKQHIAAALKDKKAMVGELKQLGIRYILLSTTSSDDSFRFLADSDLKTLRKGGTLMLYQLW